MVPLPENRFVDPKGLVDRLSGFAYNPYSYLGLGNPALLLDGGSYNHHLDWRRSSSVEYPLELWLSGEHFGESRKMADIGKVVVERGTVGLRTKQRADSYEALFVRLSKPIIAEGSRIMPCYKGIGVEMRRDELGDVSLVNIVIIADRRYLFWRIPGLHRGEDSLPVEWFLRKGVVLD